MPARFFAKTRRRFMVLICGLLMASSAAALSAEWHEQVTITIKPAQEDGLVAARQTLRMTADMTDKTGAPLEGTLSWEVHDEENQRVSHYQLTRKMGKQENRTFPHFYRAIKPGFYRATCSFAKAGQEKAVSDSVWIGYDVENIRPPMTQAADFDLFWEETLAELKSVAPKYRVTKQTGKNDAITLYEVEMRSLGNVRVRGWLEIPRAAGPHPVLLRVPSYGQGMKPMHRFEDMIVFSFNIRGHGNSQDDVKGRPENFWIRGLDDEKGYFYQGAYMDCVRAVDFLFTREEVDTKRIAITGTSQGGGLSMAAAALDPRIALCAPDVPFLVDWVHYFKLTTWPEMEGWIAAQERRTWKSTLKTLSYFDVMNLNPRIKCPVFMGVGLQDRVCPPQTIFAAYNRIPGRKQCAAYLRAGHALDKAHHERKYAWIREQFALPR